MKGKLHKSMNYGWMIQDEVDSFYPLYPYDLFTNSIERVEGKEVDFIVVHSWNAQEEKLIEVAIISANITDVPFNQETLYTEKQVREAYINAYMLEADADERENAIQSANYYIQSLKQPKKD
jgi:hypothetical protein